MNAMEKALAEVFGEEQRAAITALLRQLSTAGAGMKFPREYFAHVGGILARKRAEYREMGIHKPTCVIPPSWEAVAEELEIVAREPERNLDTLGNLLRAAFKEPPCR